MTNAAVPSIVLPDAYQRCLPDFRSIVLDNGTSRPRLINPTGELSSNSGAATPMMKQMWEVINCSPPLGWHRILSLKSKSAPKGSSSKYLRYSAHKVNKMVANKQILSSSGSNRKETEVSKTVKIFRVSLEKG